MKVFKLFQKSEIKLDVASQLIKLDSQLQKHGPLKRSAVDESDRLRIRISPPQLSYREFFLNDLTYKERLSHFIRTSLARNRLLNPYCIDNSRENSRIALFEIESARSKGWQLTTNTKIVFFLISAYAIGYLWAKMRYCTKLRRYGYIYFSSFMLFYELVDDVLLQLDAIVDEVVPREGKSDDVQFQLLYLINRVRDRRKLRKEIRRAAAEERMETDFNLSHIFK